MFWWVVLVAVVVVAVRGRKKRKGVPYRYTGMLLLVGVPGSGKTYKMIKLMVQRLAEGRFVRVNFNVRHDRVYLALRRVHRLDHETALAAVGRIGHLDTFEDFLDAYDCDVFLDEAQDTLSSADWQSFPHEVVQWFAQHRHRLCRVVLASHRYGSIHNYVRELVGEIELARPAPWYARAAMLARGSAPLLQYVVIKDAEEGVTPSSGPSTSKAKGGKLLFSMSAMVLDPLTASCYDTHGGVRPSPMARVRAARRKGKDEFVLAPRVERLQVSASADGLPALEHGELVELLRPGGVRAGALARRWSLA